jgi:hypothetical protein
MNRVRFGLFAVAALIAPSFVVLSASPSAAAPAPPPPAAPDTRELERTSFTLDGRPLPKPHYPPAAEARRAGAETHRAAAESRRPPAGARRAGGGTPAVGTVRQWLGLDDTTGKYYRKSYTLRAIGRHIEVWVAQDLAFPAGDCRKDSIAVTDTQVDDLI